MTLALEPTTDTPFIIAGREFRSRLLVGTGKYASNDQMIQAIDASGAEVVTVAVRRERLVEHARKADHGGLIGEDFLGAAGEIERNDLMPRRLM